jgi:hypothetical protein
MYLKLRYTFFMLLGKPASSTTMRSQLEQIMMKGRTAAARDSEVTHHMALYVKKKGSTPEGWLVEMEGMTSKSAIGKQYWISFVKKQRAKREGEFNAGRSSVGDATWVNIRHFMELVLEDDKAAEGITSHGRMHAIRTSEGSQDDEWHQAIEQIDHMQRQHQEELDRQEERHQQQTNMYHTQVRKEQDKYQRVNTKGVGKNGLDIWSMCDCCCMYHIEPRNESCCQRSVKEDGAPVAKWAQWNGWNLEYLATLQQNQVDSTFRKMAHITQDKAIDPGKVADAKNQIKQIKTNSPSGKYRGGGGGYHRR